MCRADGFKLLSTIICTKLNCQMYRSPGTERLPGWPLEVMQ
jgi:hypothetical protein